MAALWIVGVFITLVWIVPIGIAQDIGKKRNRDNGWVFGLLLGWLGVLIIACTGYLPSDAERRVRELEAQRVLDGMQQHSDQATLARFK